MGFKLSDNAQAYYKQIKKRSKSGNFVIMFDFYYLCCIMGMLKEKLPQIGTEQDFIRVFPSEYYKQRYHLLGLLIIAEVRRTGLDTTNRKNLESFMLNLVSMDNPIHLSDDGEKYLNRYAEGGYQIIFEEIGSMEDYTSFMIKYQNLLESIS